MAIKKILVTGSSGTIGTALCQELIKRNFDVIGVDIVPNKWDDDVNKKTNVLDLKNENALEKLPKDIDLIIHLAAHALVFKSVINPQLAKDNFLMLFNMLEFARKHNIKRFMFASSREVYGNTENILHGENDVDIKNCESPYSASKMAGEALVHAYGKCYGIDYIIFRFSNVYGKYDDSDRVVPLFIRLTLENKDLTVFGKDKMLDFTYIDDTVEGIVKAIEHFESAKNNVFNIAYGEGNSILQIAELIKESLNGKNNVIIKESRTGEVIKYIADIQPKFDLREGIKKSVEWYKNFYSKKGI